ncbi:hypothetical protein IQ249_18215 [Lusitaniella coriacea LEGE 07157]|uniref:Uncharacterized protein n=1 Tax=Lusitaniella coriacea LEGE 07157 TaxID=945747 RepID=A0A8J7IW86_9CYAN|nr:hypothetical protein [Lusitaniella coriacea]MBE9117838.1 hypothetical protein [Lusitaniella coriacea LEGE 07157]
MKHNPQQPKWVLVLAQSVKKLTDEKYSLKDKAQALSEIQQISKERQLSATELWSENLYLFQQMAWVREQELTLAQELSVLQARTEALIRELSQFQAEVQKGIRELSQVKAEVSSKLQEVVQKLTQTQKFTREKAQIQELTQAKVEGQELVQQITQLQKRGQEQAQRITRNLFQAKAYAQEILQTQEDAQEILRESNWWLARKLELVLTQMHTDLFTSSVEIELEKTHGLTLQQERKLESIWNSEPNHARTWWHGLTLLILVLGASQILLIDLKDFYRLSLTAQLATLLPEECVAELGILERRLKKAKASPWKIRRRLLTEILTLLWVFYVPISLENLWLPSRDREIDD